MTKPFCTNEISNGALYFTASSYFHTRKSFHFYARSGRTLASYMSGFDLGTHNFTYEQNILTIFLFIFFFYFFFSNVRGS